MVDPMAAPLSGSELVLRLGMLMGTISHSESRDALLSWLRTGDLHPEYLVLLRDQLTELLIEAGHEAPPAISTEEEDRPL